ncbi:MAG TPA: dihydrofolate reductase family protein, partial [Nocardioidaceae bacterium]|nr:dihydrofolate reductase family protein [Nocardioidaceae bacterium]
GARWQYRRMAGTRPLTQYLVASSIDGFIADEHDNLDWLLQFGDGPEDDDTNPYNEFIKDVGPLAMGATTYEWIDRNYPGTWFYDDRPTWVFTHRELPRITGANLIFTSEPVPEVHADMVAASGGKNIWLVGGGDLVGQFLDHDLLDELWLSVAPVTLGRGAPLLPRRHTRPMRLVAMKKARGDTFAHLRYSLR